MSQRKTRKNTVIAEILELRSKKRDQYRKCLFALLAILVFVAGKIMLEVNGIIEADSLFMATIMMVVTIGLAILGGMASIEATKCKNTINALMAKYGVTENDIIAFQNAEA